MFLKKLNGVGQKMKHGTREWILKEIEYNAENKNI